MLGIDLWGIMIVQTTTIQPDKKDYVVGKSAETPVSWISKHCQLFKQKNSKNTLRLPLDLKELEFTSSI